MGSRKVKKTSWICGGGDKGVFLLGFWVVNNSSSSYRGFLSREGWGFL